MLPAALLLVAASSCNAQPNQGNNNAQWKAETNVRLSAFALPAVVMERHHGHHPYRPHYRIEIYKDGRGYYYGLRNVRVLGEVPFQLSAQQVTELVAKFEELGFWELESDLDFSAHPATSLSYQFELRVGQREKRIYSVGDPKVGVLHVVLERLANSARWRCPFAHSTTQDDLCASEEQTLKYYSKTLDQRGAGGARK